MRARGEGLDFKRRAKDLISLESPFFIECRRQRRRRRHRRRQR